MNPLIKKHQSIIYVIAYSIENDEKGIKSILKRNGVDTSFIKTKRALRKAFISSLEKSKAIALDFNRYIEMKKKTRGSSELNAHGGMFSSVNLDDFKLDSTINNPFLTKPPSPLNSGIFLGGNLNDGSKNNNTIENSTSTFQSSNRGFFSGLNLKDLLNTGVNVLEIQRDLQLSNDNKEAIGNAVQIKQDEINFKPINSKSSTGLYVLIGIVGLSIIGGIYYFATKKS